MIQAFYPGRCAGGSWWRRANAGKPRSSLQPTWADQEIKTRLRRGEHVASSAPARKIEAWRDTATNVETGHQVLGAVLRQTEGDLGALLIHDDTGRGRSFVAAGAPWFMTLFGRDGLLTAWMALPLDVGLSIGTLQQLAAVQGRRVDPITEEQPGRIMHEIRRGPASADVLGGSIYYGSVDATPLFVMLLAECWRWGADETAVRALLPAADAALAWAEQLRRPRRRRLHRVPARDRPRTDQPGLEGQLRRDQRRRPGTPPSRRSRCARSRATSTPPCWRGPSSPTRSATRRRRRGCRDARRRTARPSSSKRSGCPKRVGTQLLSTAASVRSTR